MSTSTPYIHSSRDVSGICASMVEHYADETRESLTLVQSYDTIMWDAVLRHAKFTVGFLVEASYL